MIAPTCPACARIVPEVAAFNAMCETEGLAPRAVRTCWKGTMPPSWCFITVWWPTGAITFFASVDAAAARAGMKRALGIYRRDHV